VTLTVVDAGPAGDSSRDLLDVRTATIHPTGTASLCDNCRMPYAFP
jgi:hypothetical protein